ncbi:MAG TPA: hypothetical protein VN205_02020 [Thermomonas sp.]|nr:hypothetical protein [Thermomonas sp.]
MKLTALLAGLLLAGVAHADDRPKNIVEEGQLGKTHMLAAGTQLAAPGYPGAYSESGDDVCIALGYTVRPDGSTGDFRLLQAWSSDRARAEQSERYLDTFAAAAADAVSQWRFASREEGGPRTVSTVATLTFRGGNSAGQGLADRCRIGDLAMHYARLENGRIPVRRTMERAREGQIAINMRHNEALANRAFAGSP